MHEELIDALVKSSNEAADDLLLEGLRAGVEIEQAVILRALLARMSLRGLVGIVEQFSNLPERLQLRILGNIRAFHQALREAGRSDRNEVRLAAMKLIAISRQGKLAYVISENLNVSDDRLNKSAVDALVALARWASTTTRRLQRDPAPEALATNGQPEAIAPAASVGDARPPAPGKDSSEAKTPEPPFNPATAYRELMEQRGEIEVAVARALDIHRGKHVQELLRAALLLCDWPGSKTLAILHIAKHGGQSPMVRRLQQPPASEHAEAFLLGATHGQLRLHFGSVFSHINEGPVLDALLKKTHWLKDQQLQHCMHQVSRGMWWQESELLGDLHRRTPQEACRIGEWISVSAMHDLMQDERLTRLAEHAHEDVGSRLRLLRIAARRKKGGSVQFLKFALGDSDERLVRMAAREIVRRRPVDFENMLLRMMTDAPESVRRVISRSIGQAGFEHYWQRFDRLDRPTRKQAGRAMLKLLPDASQRLGRYLAWGPVEQRLKAMQIAHELGLAETLRDALVNLTTHPLAKVRSKAVAVLGELPSTSIDVMMERILNDTDPRVRANAIEALETRPAAHFIPTLARHAKSPNGRERANAIKALHRMKVGSVTPQLLEMLRDSRAEHRISAMWALKQTGLWKLLSEVGRMAKEDDNIRVRRYAVGLLKGIAELVQTLKQKVG